MATHRYSDVVPRTRLCMDGRWLAVSEDGAKLRIGVEGATEQGAISKFYDALEAWARLWEQGTHEVEP